VHEEKSTNTLLKGKIFLKPFLVSVSF